MSATRLRFARYLLDLDRGALLLDGAEVALRPKTFAVLCHLAANAGRLVSKEELFAAAWPNVVVTDDALVQSIGELRRALGEADARWITTVPRRGYRFEAPVSEDAGRSEAPPPPAPPLTKPRRATAAAVVLFLAAAVAGVALGAARSRTGDSPPPRSRANRRRSRCCRSWTRAAMRSASTSPTGGAGHHQRAGPLFRADRDVVERGVRIQGQAASPGEIARRLACTTRSRAACCARATGCG